MQDSRWRKAVLVAKACTLTQTVPKTNRGSTNFFNVSYRLWAFEIIAGCGKGEQLSFIDCYKDVEKNQPQARRD